MTPENTQIAFFILFAIACCLWMLGLWFSLRIGEGKRSAWQDARAFQGPSGEIESEMPAAEFIPRFKKLLRYQAISVSVIKFVVSEESEHSVTFKKLGPVACNLPTGLMFDRVNLHTHLRNGQQVIRYQVNQGKVTKVFKKIALGICLFLGIPALMVLSALIWHFCVQNPNPTMRWQVFQMLQISHVLWPPFLFVMIARQMQRGVKFFMENMIEHAADPNVSESELNVSFAIRRRR